ncbi:MAG: hypothetical protein V4451_16270 [Pseudomonadota bacterium]
MVKEFMKNIPKLIPVAYLKAYKEDGKFVWGDDCVAATNDFEDDRYIGVPVVRLADALDTTPSVSSTTPPSEGQQARAADVAVAEKIHLHKMLFYALEWKNLGNGNKLDHLYIDEARAFLSESGYYDSWCSGSQPPASPVAVPEGQHKVAESGSLGGVDALTDSEIITTIRSVSPDVQVSEIRLAQARAVLKAAAKNSGICGECGGAGWKCHPFGDRRDACTSGIAAIGAGGVE